MKVSCGLRELAYITGTKDAIDCKEAIQRMYNDHANQYYCQVLFSDIVRYGRRGLYRKTGGTRLAEYIKTHGLGEIISTRPRKNPNTGNTIQSWLWNPPTRSTAATRKLGIKIRHLRGRRDAFANW